jgi:membrane protein DedA with SNARE-associated domain
LHFPSLFIGLSIASIIAGLVSYFSELSFWIVFIITIVGMFINSIIAEVEDNSPGGFNNPSEKDK